MRAYLSLLAGVIGATAWVGATYAAPMTDQQYQDKLKAYDPAAIQAATSYAKTFDVMGFFQRTAPRMAMGLEQDLRTKNPGITDDQVKQFVDTFERVALVESADVINHAVVLALLEALSAEELGALDKFYSTPVGQSILKKFPVLSEKLAAARKLMTTEIVPMAMDAAKAKLKAAGVDVTL